LRSQRKSKGLKTILIYKGDFMKKILMAAVAALTLGYAGGDIVVAETPTPAPELTGFYVGAGYAYIDAEATDGFDTADFSNNAVDLRVGYNVNEYLAVEGRYAIGAEDAVTISGDVTDIDARINTWGIFVKPQYPVTADATVYGLIGYGNVDGKASNAYGSESIDENGFQWGLGAKYSVTTNVEVFVDYINAYDDTVVVEDETLDLDVYTVTIGVNYKF
jgi:opacity protein-like surface antigen